MSDPASNPPNIEGAKDTDKDEELKVEQEQLSEQVIHMDLVTTDPVEVQQIQKDYDGVPSQESLIATTKEVLDDKTNINVNATLKKGRKARANIKKVEKMEGTDGAQGTPIPDYWKNYMDFQQTSHSEILAALKDLRTFRGEAAPLQDIHIVEPTTKTVMIEDPVNPETMIAQPQHAVPPIQVIPSSLPDASQSMSMGEKRERDFETEGESYTKRFKTALKANFSLENDAVRQRASQDTSMGNRYVDKSVVYF